MREFKFRAWIKKEKRMDDVNFINFAAQFVGKWECRKPHADLLNYKDEVTTRRGKLCNLEDVELMQYTGLKDKNGKEIYEGDIVKISDDIYCQVMWFDKFASFFLINEIGEAYKMSFVHNYEVIGNIYENPELLEV